MRRAFCVVVAVLIGWGIYSVAAEPTPEGVAAKTELDCGLYTKPYQSNEHGAFFLPAGLQWRVMPRYVGIAANGERIVDDRITLVLVDDKNKFWPFIAKMSLEEAESLEQKLAKVIADKRK